MRQTISLAGVLLLVGSVLAVAANTLRPSPLSYIREPLPPMPAAFAPPSVDAVVAGEPQKAGVVSVDQVLGHLEQGSAHFVDARGAEEYAKGHLRGAIHLPSDAIYQNIDRILQVVPPIEKVIVYCGGGDCEASHNVADVLRRDFGFTDVWIYEQGWAEVMTTDRFRNWTAAGEQP